MSSLTAYEITSKIGQKIDYAISVYELLLDCGYSPGDAENNDLLYLHERIASLLSQVNGGEPMVATHKPRWTTKG